MNSQPRSLLTASQHFLAFAVDAPTWELFLALKGWPSATLSSSPSSIIAVGIEVGLPAYPF